MTAEIAIANCRAVVMAADSAVTIGSSKVYNSAEKLFSLSSVNPVGVMIYGNATLMGVPWESLIHACSKELANTTFDTLEEYADYLLSFLKTHPEYLPIDNQEEWVVDKTSEYFYEILNKVSALCESWEEDNGEPAPVDDILSMVIENYHGNLRGVDYVIEADKKIEKSLRAKYKSIFEDLSKSVFDGFKLKSTLINKLSDIGVFLLSRSDCSHHVTGVVVSGYGDKEIFPSICSLEVEGYVDGLLRYWFIDEKSSKIQATTPYSIKAFAQEDVINTFIEGIDYAIYNFISKSTIELMLNISNLLDGDEFKIEPSKLEGIKCNLYTKALILRDGFMDDLGQFIKENNIDSIINTIPYLLKENLAEMAETLVNLTAFNRKLTESLETVGGPVDVAIITKGEGMVWVKRKQYYSREINR